MALVTLSAGEAECVGLCTALVLSCWGSTHSNVIVTKGKLRQWRGTWTRQRRRSASALKQVNAVESAFHLGFKGVLTSALYVPRQGWVTDRKAQKDP